LAFLPLFPLPFSLTLMSSSHPDSVAKEGLGVIPIIPSFIHSFIRPFAPIACRFPTSPVPLETNYHRTSHTWSQQRRADQRRTEGSNREFQQWVARAVQRITLHCLLLRRLHSERSSAVLATPSKRLKSCRRRFARLDSSPLR